MLGERARSGGGGSLTNSSCARASSNRRSARQAGGACPSFPEALVVPLLALLR